MSDTAVPTNLSSKEIRAALRNIVKGDGRFDPAIREKGFSFGVGLLVTSAYFLSHHVQGVVIP